MVEHHCQQVHTYTALQTEMWTILNMIAHGRQQNQKQGWTQC